MDRKLKLKVMRNGPNKESQEELDFAAWLIKNGLAEGDFIPDMGRPGGHAKNIVWRGLNIYGERYMSKLNLLYNLIFNPYVVAIFSGLLIAVITVFIFQPWQDASQSINQPVLPEKLNK